jgi:hypothetical protein
MAKDEILRTTRGFHLESWTEIVWLTLILGVDKLHNVTDR